MSTIGVFGYPTHIFPSPCLSSHPKPPSLLHYTTVKDNAITINYDINYDCKMMLMHTYSTAIETTAIAVDDQQCIFHLCKNGNVYVSKMQNSDWITLSISPCLPSASLLIQEKIIAAATGHRHCVLLSDAGCVYSFGSRCYDGQLGLGEASIDITIPTKIPLRGAVIAINAHSKHSLLLVNHCDIFSVDKILPDSDDQCHSNVIIGYGAIPGISQTLYTPTLLFPNYVYSGKLINISTGPSHCMALTDSGKVYAWGFNLYGSCGVESSLLCPPTEHQYASNMKQSADSVNGTRDGEDGRLLITIPILVSFPRDVRVVAAACGYWHTVFLAKRLLHNSSGTSSPVLSPSPPSSPWSSSSLSPPQTQTLVETSLVYACGKGDDYQLGLSYNDLSLPSPDTQSSSCLCQFSSFTPTCITYFNNKNVIKIAAGSRHTVAVTSSNHVFIWGYNGHGQLYSLPSNSPIIRAAYNFNNCDHPNPNPDSHGRDDNSKNTMIPMENRELMCYCSDWGTYIW